jgi:4-hydroxy-3-polyprenylbenzoate decarboxylase
MTDRMVVGLTRGPGAAFGIRLLELLVDTEIECHLVIGPSAESSIREQTGLDSASVRRLADHVYNIHNQAARISSGSFITKGMVIAPCNIDSLEAIATGMASNLLYRAADVTVKEGRKLVLLLTQPSTEPKQAQHTRRLSAVPGVVLLPRSVDSPATLDSNLIDLTARLILREFGIMRR